MHKNVEKLNSIKANVKEIVKRKQLKTDPKIIAISKTFSVNHIIPLLESGHIHFGENKIQEAESKWHDIKNKYGNINLHMVGKLQTNKAKKAVELFDFIHSLDSEKLAKKLSSYENELSKKNKMFIQINLGEEKQKSGILLKELHDFYYYCTKEMLLNIIGLMCLPPIGFNSNNYFKVLKIESEKLNLRELSMGMSSDYEKAILNGSTYLRLGTLIFGKRKT